jgi:hypothetical protein
MRGMWGKAITFLNLGMNLLDVILHLRKMLANTI